MNEVSIDSFRRRSRPFRVFRLACRPSERPLNESRRQSRSEFRGLGTPARLLRHEVPAPGVRASSSGGGASYSGRRPCLPFSPSLFHSLTHAAALLPLLRASCCFRSSTACSRFRSPSRPPLPPPCEQPGALSRTKRHRSPPVTAPPAAMAATHPAAADSPRIRRLHPWPRRRLPTPRWRTRAQRGRQTALRRLLCLLLLQRLGGGGSKSHRLAAGLERCAQPALFLISCPVWPSNVLSVPSLRSRQARSRRNLAPPRPFHSAGRCRALLGQHQASAARPPRSLRRPEAACRREGMRRRASDAERRRRRSLSRGGCGAL